MNNNNMNAKKMSSLGAWLPKDKEVLNKWVENFIFETRGKKQELLPVVQELKELIENNPEVYMFTNEMLGPEATLIEKKHECIKIKDYDEMLQLINAVLNTAPSFNETDLVGFPINAILDCAMATPAGTIFFLDKNVNEKLYGILSYWCEFLDSKDSLYVLNSKSTGWMSQEAQGKIGIEQYRTQEQLELPHWGYTSWNDFFTRKFKDDNQRPIAEPNNDKVIVAPCESTPYNIEINVQKHSKFWIKEQPYSLKFMLALEDEYVDRFVGGMIYQAFLSAYNYHRWHSPVNGIVKKAFVKQGSYYAEALSEGFDPAGPNNSQGYISQVATRAIMIIETENMGLVGLVTIGMAEVSSCKFEVEVGDKVKKGQDIGYFQYGGSTSCLIFEPNVIDSINEDIIPNDEHKVILVNSKIATAK